MKKPSQSNEAFKKFQKAKRKLKPILAKDREREGMVLWQDLTTKERTLFENTYLATEAVTERRKHLNAVSKLPDIEWVQILSRLWSEADFIKRLETEARLETPLAKSKRETKSLIKQLETLGEAGPMLAEARRLVKQFEEADAVQTALEEVKQIHGEHLRALSWRLIWSIMNGNWDTIRDLAEVGRLACPEGIDKRAEPPITPVDACDALPGSSQVKHLILDGFFILVGSGEPDLLWEFGEYPPFDAQDSPSQALLKHRPRFRDNLIPSRLPTKRRLQDYVEERSPKGKVNVGRYSQSLNDLGLNMLPEGRGGTKRKRSLMKKQLNEKGEVMKSYLVR